MTVTEEQKKLLQSTAYIINDEGKQTVSKFFDTLFREYPEYLNYFNQTNQATGKQPDALGQTIYHFIQNLDNLDAMKPQMSRLSNKHRAVCVKPELYPNFGKVLVRSVTEALGSKGTPEVAAAWQALYDLMTSTFMKKEKELYEQLGNNEADKGFVPFTIVKKETIASGPIYLLELQRQDGGKLWNYVPGQYLTLSIEKGGIRHQGHYPLLEPFNGKTYSVALKHGGIDQNIIPSEEIIINRQVGSTVLASAPSGSFGLVNDAKRHLFIGGGMGIAALMPLVHELNQQGKASSATLIQCVRTEGHAAFGNKLRSMLPQGQYIMLTEKDPLSKNHIQGKLHSDTHVYISGSEHFLSMAENALGASGHPKSQIHYKSIEPTQGLLKAINQKNN